MVFSFVLGALMVVGGIGLGATGVIDAVIPIAGVAFPGGVLIVIADLYRRGVIRVDEPGGVIRVDEPGGVTRVDEPGREPGQVARRAPTSSPIRLPEELAHLPLTSAAEFREAARPMHRTVLTSNASYLAPVGLRGVAALGTGLLAITCIGELFTGPGSLQETLLLLTGGVGLSAVTVLLVVSKHRSNRRRKHQIYLNDVLRDASARVDREVEAGRIPLTPPGWQGEVPPSLG